MLGYPKQEFGSQRVKPHTPDGSTLRHHGNVPPLLTLLHQQTVVEGGNVQHVEQRRLGLANFVPQLDQVHLILVKRTLLRVNSKYRQIFRQTKISVY